MNNCSLLQQLIDSICLFLTEIKSSFHFNKKGFGNAKIVKRSKCWERICTDLKGIVEMLCNFDEIFIKASFHDFFL